MARSTINQPTEKGSRRASGRGVLGWAKGVLLFVFCLLALVLGVWVSVDNPQVVTVVLMGFAVADVAVGVLMTGLLFVGAILGFFFSLLPTLKLTNENLSLKRKLKRRDKELERLRKAPLKD